MTTELTQGQQRLKTVNQVALGLFLLFVVLGELYFSSFFLTGNGTPSLSLMMSSLTFIVPTAVLLTYYLRNVIKTIYVRETAERVEGFYTQRSWLDVDDSVLVAVVGEDICFFEVPERKLPDVQKAYQHNASFQELVSISGIARSKVINIKMAMIEKMSSSHKTDTIEIEVDSDYHSIEFLNIKTKQHALKRFQLLLHDDMVFRKTKPSRLRASSPWLITLVVFALLMFFFQNALVWAVAFGVGVFFILPKMLRELIDPTQLEIWEVNR